MTVGELLNILDVEVEQGSLTLDSIVFVKDDENPVRAATVDMYGDLIIS